MRSIRTATAGLVLAVGLSVASVGLVGVASAAPAQPGPHPVKAYPTWQAAQKAARFQLLKPANTEGLKRRGGILVVACPRRPRTVGSRSRQVIAMYSATRRPGGHLFVFSQNTRSHAPCPVPLRRPRGKVIARVHVDGVIAVLTRAHVRLCLLRGSGKPKCSTAVVLQLSWAKNRHFYRITGIGQRPVLIIGFARNLVTVK
jgi:hypothetical protein